LANRSPIEPPPTRYGAVIIQNRSDGGNPSSGRVPAPPTKFGPTIPSAIQAKPATPPPTPVPRHIAQPATIAVGGLAIGGGLAVLGGLRSLWNRGYLAGQPARIRTRIASNRYLSMRNLDLQQVLAGGDRMVRILAARYVEVGLPYAPTRLIEFRAVLDDFEMGDCLGWANRLRTAYIANLEIAELRALTPVDLAGGTQQLADRVVGLYIGRDYNNLVGSLKTNNVLIGLQNARQEIEAALTYLGVPAREIAGKKKALAGPLLRRHWPFLTVTKRLFDLAVSNPANCAAELFGQIVQSSGYRYDSSFPWASELSEGRPGNCQAMTNDFQHILSLFGIASTFTTVEAGDDRHRFIVACPRFIDRQVQGNIYDGNRHLKGFYVFQNHHALTIGRRIYDVMAGTTYQRLNKLVELVLLNRYLPTDPVLVFRRVGDGAIMNGKNRLVVNYGSVGAGRLPRCELFNQGDDCPALGRTVP
jgi:hypothetical protein